MTKIKQICTIVLFTLIVYSCKKDSEDVFKPFDHAGQAVEDNNKLVDFFKKNYYDSDSKSVKPLIDGKKPLKDDPKLKTQDVNEYGIDYKLYYYVIAQGNASNVSPTQVDSVMVNYEGKRILSDNTLSSSFDKGSQSWMMLTNVIKGWTYGVSKIKAGSQDIPSDDEPIKYNNSGDVILFIPSGLGYRNKSSIKIPANQNLMFNISLLESKHTDLDRDGVKSHLEDIDGDGNPVNDDTDGDKKPNFLDIDDDGDNIPTIYEDANKDGDPTNDFSDPNKPTVPDYLNIDIRKSNK